jgi:uncharacterized protein HemX
MVTGIVALCVTGVLALGGIFYGVEQHDQNQQNHQEITALHQQLDQVQLQQAEINKPVQTLNGLTVKNLSE